MAKVYVHDTATDNVRLYNLSESDSMPYVTGGTLTVGEFRGSSNSSYLWTTKQAMQAWNSFRSYYGSPIHVRYAFKRIWEGGHGYQSQHYAGVAFDCGQNLSSSERDELRSSAINSGDWGYVEPAHLTPTWVHMDRREDGLVGFPTTRFNDRGIYVLILSDALCALGFYNNLTYVCGETLVNAIGDYQRSKGLSADGVCGPNTWDKITRAVRGIGQTPTVVNP